MTPRAGFFSGVGGSSFFSGNPLPGVYCFLLPVILLTPPVPSVGPPPGPPLVSTPSIRLTPPVAGDGPPLDPPGELANCPPALRLTVIVFPNRSL